MVIHISEYSPAIPNTTANANLVKSKLEQLDYTVTHKANPTPKELQDAFTDFILDLGKYQSPKALVYITGHGVSRRGKQQIQLSKGKFVSVEVRSRSVAILTLPRQEQLLKFRSNLHGGHLGVVFDSCRTQALGKQQSTSFSPAKNTFFMFSTAQGHIAHLPTDGSATAYTKSLCKHLDTKTEVVMIQRKVAQDLQYCEHPQEPWYSESLKGGIERITF